MGTGIDNMGTGIAIYFIQISGDLLSILVKHSGDVCATRAID